MKEEALGSFSFDVTERILAELNTRGPIKRTNLAMFTGMNYKACARYVKMIQMLGWMNLTRDGEVSIIPIGHDVMRRLHGISTVLSPEYANNINKRLASFPEEKGDLIRSPPTKTRNRYPGTKGKLPQKRPTMRKVMVVDDDEEVAMTFEAFLTSTGRYSVKAFTKPYPALREFAPNLRQYDLVVLDIRRPDMNGLRLYQSLYAMNSSCKFMFVSSLDSADELLSMLPGIGK